MPIFDSLQRLFSPSGGSAPQGAPVPDAQTRLYLYKTDWCGFCRRVQRVLPELDAPIEQRDVGDPEHRQALLAARGRGTVPVLRIQTADGEDVWMPESLDIIAWLREHYGDEG